MTITAAVIADSISPHGFRPRTMQLRYPKFIHGELMTHRLFSRNASSSRAIPVERMIEDVLRDPAMPIFWGKNQPGMQAREQCNASVVINEPDSFGFGGGPTSYDRQRAWLHARDEAIETARAFHAAGYHKQIVNRIIEPWCHINVVVTSTDWANFFALRRHADAQPEMRALADAIWEAQRVSKPTLLRPGEWHTPYVSKAETDVWAGDQEEAYDRALLAVRCSVARCARVSYLTHEGKTPSVEGDLKLHDLLVGSVPLHASPAEHQATPDRQWDGVWEHPEQHGNLRGWRQYRRTLANECLWG